MVVPSIVLAKNEQSDSSGVFVNVLLSGIFDPGKSFFSEFTVGRILNLHSANPKPFFRFFVPMMKSSFAEKLLLSLPRIDPKRCFVREWKIYALSAMPRFFFDFLSTVVDDELSASDFRTHVRVQHFAIAALFKRTAEHFS